MSDLTDQAIDPSSRLPLYAQLEQILEQQLMSGELKAGDMLPTEAQLCAQFGISRPVVRQAISGFVARGQLYRLRGKGTFVSGAPLAERLLRPTLGFFDDLAAAGLEVSNDLVGIEVVAAHAGLAESLALAPGGCRRPHRAPAPHRRRGRRVHALVPPGVAAPEPARADRDCDYTHSSLAGCWSESIGIRPQSGHRWVQAVVADAEVGGHLGIAVGEALLYVESVEDDDRGRRIEYSQAWHRGDRTRLELESSRPD